MGHDHGFTFSSTTGPEVLWSVQLLLSVVLAAAALLHPFRSTAGSAPPVLLTSLAGGAALVLLVLAEGVDVPDAAVAGLLAALVVPIAAAVRHDRSSTRAAVITRLATPFVLVGAAGGAVVESARVWLGAPRSEIEPLLSTGVLFAFLGVSWLTVWTSRSRAATVGTGVAAWIFGNTILAGVTYSALNPA